jgi:parvulin-like peptidyl-prolyl isomerase
VSLTPEELQIASDDFRRRNRLLAAADTNAWLAAQRLSLDNFQARLERDVLAAKVPRHLTSAAVDRHFAAQQAGFDRVRLAQVVVGRADVAQELASQIREEGRELADVAREQGLQMVCVERFRKQLTGPLGTAKPGQLIGPVGTRSGFLLVLVEECRPAELDSVTRQRIQRELSAAWLAGQLREAKIDLAPLGLS